MVAAYREHAEAREQVEVTLILAVEQILAFAAREADVESDRLQHADKLLVQVARMKRAAFGFSLREHPRQIQLTTRHLLTLLLCCDVTQVIASGQTNPAATILS